MGLSGIAIVCHGKSNSRAIENAVKMAAAFVEKRTNERLTAAILANEELSSLGKSCK